VNDYSSLNQIILLNLFSITNEKLISNEKQKPGTLYDCQLIKIIDVCIIYYRSSPVSLPKVFLQEITKDE